jgi:carbonic anhydrase
VLLIKKNPGISMTLFLALAFLCLQSLSFAVDNAKINSDKAFQMLVDGNRRFVDEDSEHPNRVEERRLETAELQEPFATIVACSDSRVAPEIIFDQGIGDLFIVRTAGNVVGPVELDSIEYSVIYLHARAILVVGHENCGAIKAVLAGETAKIENVAELIEPAVRKSKGQPGNKVVNATKENVRLVVSHLKKSPELSQLIQDKKLSVQGGYYDFHTGKVEILKD